MDFSGFARSSAVGFSIGDKGYVGTGYTGIFRKDFWEYDSINDSWTQKADFGGSARESAVGFSIGDKGYVGTGYTGIRMKDFWEYDPTNNAWIKKADLPGLERENGVGFSIGDKGYVGTGYSGIYLKDFWEYDPTNNSWTQKADFGGGNRFGAVGFSIGNKGYIGTGNSGNQFFNDFWEYNPSGDYWYLRHEIYEGYLIDAIGFSIGNKGYFGLGHNYSQNKDDFWEYDVLNNTWSKKTSLQGLARVNAVGFSIGNHGYIGLGYIKSDFWSFSVDTTTQLSQSDALPLNNARYTDHAWSSYEDTITTAVSPVNVTIRGDLEVTGHIVNSLKFGSSSYNPMINLYKWPGSYHFGFGVFEGSTLRYQIPFESDKHRFYAGTDSIFTIFGNGNATLKGSLTANGILCTSDRRLKKNITPLTNRFSSILALNGYRYFGKIRVWVLHCNQEYWHRK